jgi:hypothetical protein
LLRSTSMKALLARMLVQNMAFHLRFYMLVPRVQAPRVLALAQM